MSKIDLKYHELLNEILEDGYMYDDPNRKGIKRIQINDYKFVHNFCDGFPALTTKRLAWKSVVGELIWILRGDDNIKYLVDNGIPIWNLDAYNHYSNQCAIHSVEPMSYERFIEGVKNSSVTDTHFIPRNTNYKLGDVGRSYGPQLRDWTGFNTEEAYGEHPVYVGQLAVLLNTLKTNPMATKKTVTYWNPAELGDTALSPCHWSFEALVNPINSVDIAKNKIDYIGRESTLLGRDSLDVIREADDLPTHELSIKFHMHSVDTFLGLSFNQAFYGLLTQIVGKMVNMKPKGIIPDLSNVHIYEPHLDVVHQQMTRSVMEHSECQLEFSDEFEVLVKGYRDNTLTLDEFIGGLKIEMFTLKDYTSYPRIKADMLPYNK